MFSNFFTSDHLNNQEWDPLINELISENIVKYKVKRDESENTGQWQDKEDLDNSFKEFEQIIDKNDHSVESCVKHLRSTCLKISDSCFKKVKLSSKNNKVKVNKNKIWYDEDCKNEKKEMNKLRNVYKRALRDNASNDKTVKAKSEYFERRRSYKRLRKKKEINFLAKKKTELKNMKSNDPEQFWRKLSLKTKSSEKKYIHKV